MAAPTVAEFRAELVEFVEEEWPDAQVEMAIDVARDIHKSSARATIWCAAHLLSLWKSERGSVVAKPDGGGRLVSGETLGQRMQSYARAAKDEDEDVFFHRTTYGRVFLMLEKRLSQPLMRVL